MNRSQATVGWPRRGHALGASLCIALTLAVVTGDAIAETIGAVRQPLLGGALVPVDRQRAFGLVTISWSAGGSVTSCSGTLLNRCHVRAGFAADVAVGHRHRQLHERGDRPDSRRPCAPQAGARRSFRPPARARGRPAVEPVRCAGIATPSAWPWRHRSADAADRSPRISADAGPQ